MNLYDYKTSSEIVRTYNVNINCNVQVQVGMVVDEAKVKQIVDVGQKYFNLCAEERQAEDDFSKKFNELPADATIKQKESREYKQLELINRLRKKWFAEMLALNKAGYYLYRM